MVITCPTCGHQGKVDPSRIPPQGANAKCPSCQNSFLIQKPAEPTSETPSQPSDTPVQAAAAPPPPEPPIQNSVGKPPVTPQSQAPAAAPQTPEAPLGFEGGEPSSSPAAGEGLQLKAPPPSVAASKDVACTGCLKLFKEEEISRVGERNLCQTCQEAFSAKAQTPSTAATSQSYGIPTKKRRFEYGGFWIRVVAYLIDGFILGLIFWFIVSPLFMKMFSNIFSSVPMMDPSTMDQAQMQAMMAEVAGNMMKTIWISQLINMILMGGYFIILEGGPGQTLGKKALGLRVVTPEGERIGYLKALARYISRIVSGIILGIGFIMAAFDDEKRTLHDRICDTRVIKV